MLGRLTWFAIGILLAAGAPVRGDVFQGSSSADFIDVGLELDLLPLVGGGIVLDADIGNVAPASGFAPPSYNVTNPGLDVDLVVGDLLGVATVADVSAATVTSSASSNVDGLPGPRTTQASHTVTGLDISVVDLPLSPDVISITADALTVTSAISGDFGALLAAGSLNVTNLQIFVAGLQIGPTLNGLIAPNTGIDLSTVLGGASLILNEQVTTGNGLNTAGLTTNAISLQLTDVGVTGVGTLNGSVIVGPTQAIVTAAVPEPSSMLLLGIVGLSCVFHQRRRIAARITSQLAA